MAGKCCGPQCACNLQSGLGVTVTGTGSSQDPFVIASDVNLTVADNSVFDLTLSGDGSTSTPWLLEVDFAPTARLTDLPDVNAPAPTNGQVLAWNDSTNQWEADAPTTAPVGSVTTDSSLEGDGSVGDPLAVVHDPLRYTSTDGDGIGLSDAGVNQMNRKFTDATARLLASPAVDLNTLSMLQSAPGELEFWNGTGWERVKSGYEMVLINGEFLAISGSYVSGLPLKIMVKQVSDTTDASGVFEVFSAVDLAGAAGVLSVTFQETGALAYRAVMNGVTDHVEGTAYRLDNGGEYTSQAVTGIAVAYVY